MSEDFDSDEYAGTVGVEGDDVLDCVICNLPIKENEYGWAGGNNASPLAEGRCCDECNTLVIIERMSFYLRGRNDTLNKDEGEDKI
tara:strand:+ start:164 stop:421 length:258 start_codon:yes stop_codon:yes gene_type:complete